MNKPEPAPRVDVEVRFPAPLEFSRGLRIDHVQLRDALLAREAGLDAAAYFGRQGSVRPGGRA